MRRPAALATERERNTRRNTPEKRAHAGDPGMQTRKEADLHAHARTFRCTAMQRCRHADAKLRVRKCVLTTHAHTHMHARAHTQSTLLLSPSLSLSFSLSLSSTRTSSCSLDYVLHCMALSPIWITRIPCASIPQGLGRPGTPNFGRQRPSKDPLALRISRSVSEKSELSRCGLARDSCGEPRACEDQKTTWRDAASRTPQPRKPSPCPPSRAGCVVGECQSRQDMGPDPGALHFQRAEAGLDSGI